VSIKTRKRVEHNGIRVELIGQSEVLGEQSSKSNFMSNGLDIEFPGTLEDDGYYDFNFQGFQKPYDSYYGNKCQLRYFIRATFLVARQKNPPTAETDIVVYTNSKREEESQPIQMEVGIPDYLNIKIDFPKNVYSMKDILEGTIEFTDVKLMIKKMEFNIVKKETLGFNKNSKTYSEDLYVYEIMDGCPIKEETIPVRMFIKGIPDVTPSYPNVSNRFSVQYFINVVILDEMNRKYFKQAEIKMTRDDN